MFGIEKEVSVRNIIILVCACVVVACERLKQFKKVVVEFVFIIRRQYNRKRPFLTWCCDQPSVSTLD